MNNRAIDDSGNGLALHFAANRLLATLSPSDRAMLENAAELIHLERGQILFEAGDDLEASTFPGSGTTLALSIDFDDGTSVEVASIGREGALGGIVSCGCAPVFSRAVVQIGGPALRIKLAALDAVKARASRVRDLFCRYSDALLAELMQSVACNAVHAIEARFCRWLLISHDRSGTDSMPLTQALMAEMLGVQRTSLNGVISKMQRDGVIEWHRGTVEVRDRARLEARACPCYSAVRRHFRAVLPDPRPQQILDAAGGQR